MGRDRCRAASKKAWAKMGSDRRRAAAKSSYSFATARESDYIRGIRTPTQKENCRKAAWCVAFSLFLCLHTKWY
jgi:hypothetical protein